jgi:hypothetical protein
MDSVARISVGCWWNNPGVQSIKAGTITKVCRKSGNAYKAVIRLRGTKPFSKTFKLRKDAKAWAERMERNIDEARAHGSY